MPQFPPPSHVEKDLHEFAAVDPELGEAARAPPSAAQAQANATSVAATVHATGARGARREGARQRAVGLAAAAARQRGDA